MKEEIVNISDTRLNVVCTFDAAEIAAENDSVINKFSRDANIPGFRKGKAPRNIILAKFSDAIKSQLKTDITNKAFNSLSSKQNELNIASITNIKQDEVDGGIVCTITVDIIPEFQLPDYKSIAIDPISVVVDDKEVQEEVRNILRQHAKYEVVERKAKNGDFVKLNYTGKFEDGTLVADVKEIPAIYGTQTNTWEEAGNAIVQSVSSVVDGIIGTKAGENKEVTQSFEKNFEIPQLAGKTIKYDLEIIEVRECILPELTEDLLKTFSVKSEDELKEKVKSSITTHKTSQARFNQREELITKLSEMTDVKIPESSIDQEAASLMNDFANSQIKYGIKAADIEARSQEIFESLKPNATTRVKVGVILEKIAKAEKIDLQPIDIENMIWQDVYSKKLDVNKYVSQLKKDNSKIADVRKRALRGKVLDHLMTIACSDLAEKNSNDCGAGENKTDTKKSAAKRIKAKVTKTEKSASDEISDKDKK